MLAVAAQAMELYGGVLLAGAADEPAAWARPLPHDGQAWDAFWAAAPREAPVVVVLALRASPLPEALPAPGERAADVAAGERAADVAAGAAALCARITEAVAALHRAPVRGRVVTVTRGTQQVTGGDALRAGDHGVLWGLAPGFVLELGDAWGGVVDLPAEPAAGDAAAALDLVLDDRGEDLAAIRGGAPWVARLVRAEAPGERSAPLPVRGDATYVVTGGLGGVGSAICRDLIARGAHYLWIAGRTEEARLSPGPAARLRALRALGAEVQYAAVDCDDPAALGAALAARPAAMPPVRGVVHGVGVVAGRPLADADEESFARVLRGKLSGAWWLHLLSRDWPLDFFVQLSSVSALWGTEGHAAYGAANGGIDAVAAYRAARGLPAVSLQFGPWSGEGIADEAMRRGLARIGVGEVSTGVGCASVAAYGAGPAAAVAICPVEWPLFAEVMAVRRRRPLFAELAGAPAAPGVGEDRAAAGVGAGAADDALAVALRALPERAREAFARERIARITAGVLGYADGDGIPEEIGFLQLGLDSVMTLDLAAKLHAELGLPLGAVDIFDHPNVTALAAYVVARLPDAAAASPAPTAAPTTTATVSIAAAAAAVAPAAAAAVTLALSPTPVEPAAVRAHAGGAGEPIAIVGMAGRFPGADSVEALWQLLREGRDGVRAVPPDRWDGAALRDRDSLTPGKIVTDQGGFLDDLARFDAGFFRIAGREAENLDPQHRMLLEDSWHALEDAGLDPSGLKGSRTGVFVGISSSDYAHLLERGGLAQLDAFYSTGTSLNAAPGRVAYLLGLNGPAIAVDTACSSSLVAIHLAIRSLRGGETDLALAGGVNAIVTPVISVVASKAHMLSPTGRCQTFSAAADGYCRAEGCGVLVLKRLRDAVRDGDRCLAVLHGSAINQDGASSGLTAPSGRAQEAVIAAALRDAGVEPAAISYLEAHGTGTPLGDPIEIGAAWAALGRGRPAGAPLLVGSIKSNIGHCESAAGVAGVIKVVLALQHRSLPANLHCEELNRRIPWDDMNLRVVDGPTRWRTSGPRLAAASSFGFSGTNAQVIVGEAPPAPAAAPVAAGPLLLPLSAPTAEALPRLTAAWRERIAAAEPAELPALAATAGAGRAHFRFRRAALGRTRAELLAALGELAVPDAPARPPRIAFLFSGQGSQYFGMGRGLYRTEPVFRQVIDACDRVAAPRLGVSIASLLDAGDGPAPDKALINQTRFTQPALVALELALAALWDAWGVTPHVVLGHSVGEIAAAIHAGVLPLPAGMELALERGRLMQDTAEGAMLAVSATLEQVTGWLAGTELDVAAINGPQSIVVAGAPARIEAFAARRRAEGVTVRPLVVTRAFHSRLMDPILPAFEAALERLRPRFADPALPILSNLTGELIRPGELGAAYWMRHARMPVLFHQSAAALRAMQIDLCLEIGPDLTLGNLLKMNELLPPGGAVASLRRGGEDRAVILGAARALYERGQDLRWVAVQAATGRGRAAAPRYPFARTRYWPATATAAGELAAPSTAGERGGAVAWGQELRSPALAGRAFAFTFSSERPAFLADHRLFGRSIVVAGAAQVGTALTALGRGGRSLALDDVVWPRALVIEEGEQHEIQVVVAPDGAGATRVGVHSQPRGGATWHEHLSARLSPESSRGDLLRTGAAPEAPDLGSAEARARRRLIEELPGAADQRFTGAECYAYMRALGYTLGDTFCWIDEIWVRGDEALVRFATPAALADASDADGYEVYPGLIDSFFQGPVAFAIAPGAEQGQTLAIPFAAARLAFVGRPARGEPLYCHVRALEGQPLPGGRRDVEVADLHAFTADGALVMIAERFRVRRAPRASLDAATGRAAAHAYELSWAPTDGPVAGAPAARLRSALVIDTGDRSGDGTGAAPGELIAALRGVADRALPVRAAELAAQRDAGLIVDAGFLRLTGGAPGAAAVARAVADLAARLQGAPPRIPFAVLVDGALEAAPLREAVWGMLATLAAEDPDRRPICLEVDAGAPAARVAAALAWAAAAEVREARLALRGEALLAARLVRAAAGPEERAWAGAGALITGGLGGLGLSVAGALGAGGAAAITLMGRSAPDAAAARAIAGLRARGVHVEAIAGDVTDPADCARAVAAAGATAPLRAVFHLAGVLDDQGFERLTPPAFERVFAAKAAGADALADALAGRPLDALVLFSSASAVLGSPGQASYAAANGYLDGLAELLRARGVPAASIDWGPWTPAAKAGMAATARTAAAAAAQGVRPLTDDDAWPLVALGYALGGAPGRGRLVAISVDLERFAEHNAGAPRQRLISGLVAAPPPSARPAKAAVPRGWLIEQLRASAEPHAALRDALYRQICEVLGEAELDEAADFVDMGLDSIMLIDLRSRLTNALGVDLPATAALDHPNLTALARHLATSGLLGATMEQGAAR